ncbi:protein kinase [Chitinispirillum alkaliphilum]|nr:protein kinase [Chitinispirillum alkaliphilum]
MIEPALPKEFSQPVRIGEGAFGSVYRVKQSALDRLVAVKIITEKDAKSRKKLLKEARVQARIEAQCIPQVFDAFEWKGKHVCIVMQWIKGVSLSSLLQTDLSVEERFSLATAFLKSLAELHRLKFAHRDLKPENILFTSEGETFLVDFGFTKDVLNGERSMSMNIKGTPAYMAPEVWECGGDIDFFKADIFSAGRIISKIIKHSKIELLSPLLKVNPDERLEDANAALLHWLNGIEEIKLECGWKKQVEKILNENLSNRLLLSAKQLIYNGRFDESYPHLVECLEIDPENREALQLVREFSQRKKKHRMRCAVSKVSAFLAVIIFLVLSFLAGKQSAGNPQAVALEKTEEFRISFLPERSYRDFQNFPVTFKTVDSPKSLKARLNFVLQSEGYTVKIGNEKLNEEDLQKGIEIAQGAHWLTVYNSDMSVARNERIELLPFQVRYIKLP